MAKSKVLFVSVKLFDALRFPKTMSRSLQGICAFVMYTLLLFFCASSVEGNMLDLCKIGLTEPLGDIKLEYGKGPLVITCVITDPQILATNPNISNIMYYTKAGGVEVQNMTQILNSTSIQLFDEHPVRSNQLYTCKLRGSVKEKDEPVCWNDVSIGVKPYEVLDFKCISINLENLTCSWTPVNTVIDTAYHLTFHYGTKNQFLECPRMEFPFEYEPKSKEIRCVLNADTEPQYRMVIEVFYFTLHMSNEFGEYTNPPYEFHHFENVRSGPPEKLEAVNTTTSSIYLKWYLPNAMVSFPRELQYRVVYQCEYGPKKWLPAGDSNGTQTVPIPKVAVHYYNLTGLAYAHALCDIRVAIRSAEARNDESMWSAHASITVRTSSRLPGAPPNTTVGSFEISFSEIATANDITRNEVYIYWQQIDDHIKNGEDFGYEILLDDNSQFERPVLKEQTSAYAKYGNLVLGNTYKFAVYSVNSQGRSVRHSEIIVPAQKLRPKEPGSFTKISFENGLYELKWEPAAHDDAADRPALTGYTLFWCSNDRDRPYQCTGHLGWIHLPLNVTSHRITVVENKQVTQFAITSNAGQYSSGMLWASCTILHDKYVGKIRDFWINNMGSTHIEVGWKLACSERIGNVAGYHIYYCPIISPKETECKGDMQTQSIEGDENLIHGRITGLIPYTTYMLRIAVVTASTTAGTIANKTSQVSDALYNTTLEAAPTAPLNLLVLNITNSSITVQCDAPQYSNGVLKFYTVTYNDKTIEVGPGSEKNNKTFELKSLQSFMTYNITIRACTTFCSQPSEMVQATTEMGYPGIISSIDKRFQNDSYVLMDWPLPDPPRGRCDYYQLKIKREIDDKNETLPTSNSIDRKYAITECGDNNRYNTFYMSVRALNVIQDKELPGPWSDEIKFFCKTPPTSSIFWLIFSTVMAVFVALLLWLSRKCYYHYKDMRNVEVKLPPGLAATAISEGNVPYWSDSNNHSSIKNLTSNLTLGMNLSSYNNSHQTHINSNSLYKDAQQEQQQYHQQQVQSDEELVLLKMSSGESDRDSSGCSTGHDSASSSIEGSTHEDDIDSSHDLEPRSEGTAHEQVIRSGDRCSSDSGTDQAISNSTDSLNKTGSLRFRKAIIPTAPDASNESTSTTGYTVVSLDPSSSVGPIPSSAPIWSALPASIPHNNYCLMGIDPSTAKTTAAVNDFPSNNTQPSANVGYVSFDSQPPTQLKRNITTNPGQQQQQMLPRPVPVSLQQGIKSPVSNGSGYIPLMYGDPSDTENDLGTTPTPNLTLPPNYVLASTNQPIASKLASLLKPHQQEHPLLPPLTTVNTNPINDKQQITVVNKSTPTILQRPQQHVDAAYVQAAPIPQMKLNHPNITMAANIGDQPINNVGTSISPGYVSVGDVVSQPVLANVDQQIASKGYIPHRHLSSLE